MSLSRNQALRLHNISFAWPGSQPLFTNLSATFSPGWTAIVGDNGIGKTTLVTLMLGRDGLKPDKGQIDPSPTSENLVTAFCAQEAGSLPENIDDFGADWSHYAIRIRTDLQIGDDWPWRFDELSGGQKKRLQIACALTRQPDVLVLDEPTNHLDQQSRHMLVAALADFARHGGIGVLVSHDRDFLDALVTKVVFLTRVHTQNGNVTQAVEISGTYSQARAQLESNEASSQASLEAANARVEKLQSAQNRAAQEAAHTAALKTGGRKIDPKDHDALGRHKLAHMTGADAGMARVSSRLTSRVASAQESASAITVAAKRYTGDIEGFFEEVEPSHRRLVAQLGPGFLHFGTASVDDSGSATAGDSGSAEKSGVEIPLLQIGPRDHIALTGANGAGKSTLIQALLTHGLQEGMRVSGTSANVSSDASSNASSDTSTDASSILVIPQECTKEEQETALRKLQSLDNDRRGRVLSGYARLNSDPDKLLSGESPSPGELRKLLLCLGIIEDSPQLIIMDEPTNHLDIGSVEALGAGLAAYPGALLLVSHDAAFLHQCTSYRWDIADGTLSISL